MQVSESYNNHRLNPRILNFEAALVTALCMVHHHSLCSIGSSHSRRKNCRRRRAYMQHAHTYLYTHCTINNVLKTTMCKPSTQEYAVSILCGPSSATGWASDGKESMTNKPLVLEITSHKGTCIHITTASRATAFIMYTCMNLQFHCSV